jgi:formylmethanofuran dehydrogenase subunit E
MKDFNFYVNKAGTFHGHVCAGIALGTKITLAALKYLGLDPEIKTKNLIVYTEIDRCMTDAIQSITGCALGRRSLKYVDYGKFAASFVNLATGKAVRATVLEHFSSEDTAEATILKISQIPEDKLVTLQEVTLKIPENDLPGPPRVKVVCASCGETVVDGRHVVKNGKTLCRACAGDAYFRPKE